jgi:tRNA (guanine-N7-)-methyltransferase
MIKQFNPRGAGSFFGRRHGKSLRDNQVAALGSLLPKLKINIDNPAPEKLESLFMKPVSKIRLEIGFGGGEHLIHEALRFPDVGFIGVEPFINGMAKIITRMSETPIENIRVFDQDAALLLDWLPENSLIGIDLFYPDPWHKSRHNKRRFVSFANLEKMALVMQKGGLFRFASDIEDYIKWTLTHVKNSGFFNVIEEDMRTPFEGWHSTRYESKALREGRTPSYLRFKK